MKMQIASELSNTHILCMDFKRLFFLFQSSVWSWSSPTILHCHTGTSSPYCCWFLAGWCSLPFLLFPITLSSSHFYEFVIYSVQKTVKQCIFYSHILSRLKVTLRCVFVCVLALFNLQMVWENGCTVIVMMTALVEDGEKQCERYWPDEGSSLYHIYEVNFLFNFELSRVVQKITLQVYIHKCIQVQIVLAHVCFCHYIVFV